MCRYVTVLNVVAVLLITAEVTVFSQDSETQEPPTDTLSRIESLENELDTLETQGRKRISSLEDELRRSEQARTELQQRLDVRLRELRVELSQQLYQNYVAAIVLMIGLFVEVIGATLLAGNSLTRVIKPVYKGRVQAIVTDLEMKSVNTDEIFSFYAYLGALLLAVGFVIQFAGTVLISGQPAPFAILAILVSLLTAGGLVFFLSGQSPQQPRLDKGIIVVKNFRRVVISPWVSFLLRKWLVQCDHCLKFIKVTEGEIWYLSEENSDEHPFLHAPMYFHFGHPECLRNIEAFSQILNPNPADRTMDNVEIKTESPCTFHNETAEQLFEFYEKSKRHWASVRNDDTDKRPSYGEVQLRDLLKKPSHVCRTK